jgi:hypothetical protein
MFGRTKTMLENLKPPMHKQPCKVRTLLESLEPADQEILEAALKDYQKWQVRTLANSLKELGFNISDRPIAKHRAKECSCWKI